MDGVTELKKNKRKSKKNLIRSKLNSERKV